MHSQRMQCIAEQASHIDVTNAPAATNEAATNQPIPASLANLAATPEWQALVLRAYTKHAQQHFAAGRTPQTIQTSRISWERPLQLPSLAQLYRTAFPLAQQRKCARSNRCGGMHWDLNRPSVALAFEASARRSASQIAGDSSGIFCPYGGLGTSRRRHHSAIPTLGTGLATSEGGALPTKEERCSGMAMVGSVLGGGGVLLKTEEVEMAGAAAAGGNGGALRAPCPEVQGSEQEGATPSSIAAVAAGDVAEAQPTVSIRDVRLGTVQDADSKGATAISVALGTAHLRVAAPPQHGHTSRGELQFGENVTARPVSPEASGAMLESSAAARAEQSLVEVWRALAPVHERAKLRHELRWLEEERLKGSSEFKDMLQEIEKRLSNAVALKSQMN
jgi:hypothetical protein